MCYSGKCQFERRDGACKVKGLPPENANPQPWCQAKPGEKEKKKRL